MRTKIIDIDFTTDSKDYIPKLEKEIEGLEIGILVRAKVLSCFPGDQAVLQHSQ